MLICFNIKYKSNSSLSEVKPRFLVPFAYHTHSGFALVICTFLSV